MLVYTITVCGAATIFTGIGFYAMRRKAPMWFWSGTEVRVEQIADVPAYNRANGHMWLAYSLLYWIAGILGMFSVPLSGVILVIASTVGMAVLVRLYKRIYETYAV